jgi:hypothetical protein
MSGGVLWMWILRAAPHSCSRDEKILGSQDPIVVVLAHDKQLEGERPAPSTESKAG